MAMPEMSKKEQERYDEALRRIEECLKVGRDEGYLDLTGLHLSRLPPEIGKLTTLGLLSLANNNLTDLPPEFRKLEYLRGLRLSGNQFNVVPPELRHLK